MCFLLYCLYGITAVLTAYAINIYLKVCLHTYFNYNVSFHSPAFEKKEEIMILLFYLSIHVQKCINRKKSKK